MLLLVVLLMLSLFLGIGAILLTMAARARTAARASVAANKANSLGDTVARDALDQALMAVLRGAASGTTGSVTLNGSQESLLADKYAPPVTGVCSVINNANTAVMKLNLDAPLARSSELNGRILTLRPQTGDGDVSSFRILGTGAVGLSAPLVYVARQPGTSQTALPSRLPLQVVINGRDFVVSGSSPFVDEYDAYDNNNDFLAHPLLVGGVFSGSYSKLSYSSSSSSSATVDNDNDGVNDGIWLSGTVIPSMPSPLGGTIRFDVSYLIVDLDGRLNVNTAGTEASLSGTTPNPISTGMGYGPADVNPSFVLPPTPPPAVLPLASSSMATFLIVGGTPTASLIAPTATQRRAPPALGRVDGRYGRTSGTSTAGRPGDDPEAAQRTTATDYAAAIGGNSQADLRARAKVFMTAAPPPAPPVLTFQLPASVSGNDWTDDPYEARLDADGPRFSTPRRPPPAAGWSDDNLFSLSELERVLRPNDVDAPQMPPRLASILSGSAQQLRMLITTDSWDTPAITGSTAAQIFATVVTGSVANPANSIRALIYPWSPINALSPDVAAGVRFNVNRPVLPGTTAQADQQQQAYCRGLYALVAALRPDFDRRRAAQWAVNALDFRDVDSRMTRFRFATNLTAGWPAAPTEEVWGAERPDLVITGVANNGSAITSITLMNPYRALVGTGTTEMVSPDLIAGGLPNTVDFKRAVGAAGDSIWRLRTTGTVVADGKNLNSTPFQPHATQTITLTPSLPLNGATTVVLERLADPASAFNATTNPYRPVDESPVSGAVPPLQWTHLPNRHFISQAELLLVRSGSLANAASTPTTQSVAIDVPELMDATYAPTLFAGHAVTIAGSTVNEVGLNEIPANNLTRWREPGRINVNTIPAGASSIWQALTGSGTGTPATNPFTAAPARNFAQMLLATPSIARLTFGTDTTGMNLARNPYFERNLAIRLANTATFRSHVFAIWITVRMTDNSAGASSAVSKRLFAIVDRSIPVGYLPGSDLNVRDMIRIKTFID